MASHMFERYGGFAALSRIVAALFDKVLASPRLSPFFSDVDMERLVEHQTKFIATVMGGPESYSKEDLRQAHSHLKIDMAAFAEMIELLEETLEDFDFDESDIDTVVDRVSSRARFIVTQP